MKRVSRTRASRNESPIHSHPFSLFSFLPFYCQAKTYLHPNERMCKCICRRSVSVFGTIAALQRTLCIGIGKLENASVMLVISPFAVSERQDDCYFLSLISCVKNKRSFCYPPKSIFLIASSPLRFYCAQYAREGRKVNKVIVCV